MFFKGVCQRSKYLGKTLSLLYNCLNNFFNNLYSAFSLFFSLLTRCTNGFYLLFLTASMCFACGNVSRVPRGFLDCLSTVKPVFINVCFYFVWLSAVALIPLCFWLRFSVPVRVRSALCLRTSLLPVYFLTYVIRVCVIIFSLFFFAFGACRLISLGSLLLKPFFFLVVPSCLKVFFFAFSRCSLVVQTAKYKKPLFL